LTAYERSRLCEWIVQPYGSFTAYRGSARNRRSPFSGRNLARGWRCPQQSRDLVNDDLHAVASRGRLHAS